MHTRSINSGLVAGLIATVMLSLVMVMKAAMGLMPQVNAIQMLTGISAHLLGTPMTPLVGWVIHFLIGTVLWGALFALLAGRLPGTFVVKGIVFSIGAWILMMVIPMPMAGAGLFGLNIGMPAPVATLVLHIVYGAILGAAYGRLTLGKEMGAEHPA